MLSFNTLFKFNQKYSVEADFNYIQNVVIYSFCLNPGLSLNSIHQVSSIFRCTDRFI